MNGWGRNAPGRLEENMEMEMTQNNNLTQDEMMLELISLLKRNGMQDKANDLFETSAYVDMLERKLDEMTTEITEVKKQLQEMQDKTFTDTIKKFLSDMVTKMENRCSEIKATLFEVKEGIKAKASEIVQEVKWKGKEALNKVSEFARLKDKLMSICEKLRQGIADTDRTIAKIDAFGLGMREAGHMAANTFRTFADKPVVDYAKKEKRFSKTEALKKPWKWQKKVYQNMELHLDAAIDKMQNLSIDVRVHMMEKKWDELYGRESTENMNIQGNMAAMVEDNKQEYKVDVKPVNRGKSR